MLRDFMETLYWKKLHKSCSYKVLREEAEQHFETTDPRVIEGYIGRTAETRGHRFNYVRQNRQAGTTAKFDYMNERRIESKEGLAQRLGLITVESDRYILHHELMPYYTAQSEMAQSSTENNESSKSEKESVDKLSACPIEDSLRKGERGENNAGCPRDIETRERRV